MAALVDIYLGYFSDDLEKAEMLIDILQNRKWTVYADRDMEDLDDWKFRLDETLSTVRCAVVLWSEGSVESDFILEEAAVAQRQQKLIPVTLDGAIPYAFEDLSTTSLAGWTGDLKHSGIQQLLSIISDRLQPRSHSENGAPPLESSDEDDVPQDLPVVLSGHEGVVQAIRFSPDGRTLATAGKDRKVRIWDYPTGTVLRSLDGHQDLVNALAFSPNGGLLLSGGQDRLVSVWNVDTGEPVSVAEGHEGTVTSVTFHPLGESFATASSDGTARIWTVDPYRLQTTINAHGGKALAAVFSPNGKHLATCGADRAIILWDTENGEKLAESDSDSVPFCLAYSADGRVIAAGHESGEIEKLDAHSLRNESTWSVHDGAVTALAVNHDGTLLASAGYDGVAVISRWADGERLTTLRHPGRRLTSVDFSPSGAALALTGENGLAQVWQPETTAVPESSQVKWVADEATDRDLLNRQALARALATRLRRFRDDEEFGGLSFLIHIDGPWGSGKSTLMNLLMKRFIEVDGPSEWLFVPFDAWRQSRVGPPWWSLLTAYRSAINESMNRRQRIGLWWAELWERLRHGGFRQLLAMILTLLACILVIVLVVPGVPSWNTLKGNVEGLTAVVGVIGAIWAGSRLVTKFLFWHSATGARMFERSHEDPMEAVAEHFHWLMRYSKKTTLFLVDDLDRCPDTFVVGLLDAMQTLLRNTGTRQAHSGTQPAYFVVAADGRWIRSSYETAYKNFSGVVDEPCRPLGYLFLDKLFQLTVRVPSLSPQLQDIFLRNLLEVERPEAQAALEEEAVAIRDKIRLSETEEEAMIAVRDARPEVQQQVAVDMVDRLTDKEVQRATKHTLQKFAHLLDPNPRSMKRFIMAYALSRTVLSLEGSWVAPNTLALWTILALRWPELAEHLRKRPGDIVSKDPQQTGAERDEILTILESEDVLRVVNFETGGPLTEENIRACCGGGATY